LTSLIAGLATGAIGAYHFHRISPLGTLGNLLAMPVVTLVVMPFAVLALALLPFGLEALPLAAMGAGIDLVVAMATWVSNLTPEDGVIGAPSLGGTLAVVAAGLVACLAPRGYRPVALLPLAASVLLYALHRQPDMLISATGTTIAVRDAAGALRVSSRPSGFLPEVWLRAEGISVQHHGNRRIAAGDLRCDKLACLVRAHGRPGADARHGASANAPPGPVAGPGPESVAAGQGPPALLVSLVRDSAAFEEDCRKADIIVSALIAPPDCRARQVFDGARLARDGAVALYFSAPSASAASRSTPALPPPAAPPSSKAGGTPAVAVRPSYGSRRPWTPR
jgi:competence protein ComEC